MKRPSMNNCPWGLVVLMLAAPVGGAFGTAGCGSSGSSSPGGAGTAEAGAAGEPALAGEGGASGEGGARSMTEQEMFDALGIDTTPSPRTFTDETGTHDLPASYNPLGRGVKSLQPQVEVYFAGRSFGSSTANQFLLDSTGLGPAKKLLPLTDAADSWAGNQFTKSVPADLDGDGIEEIVNIYYIETSHELHANVIRCTADCKGDGGKFANVKDTKLAVKDPSLKPLDRHWFSHGIVSADVDGDGKQELVIANFGGIDVCVASSSFAFTCTPRITGASQKYSLARGHFGDHPNKANDEIVAVSSNDTVASVAVYDGSPDSFAANAFTNAKSPPKLLSQQLVGETQVNNYIEAYVDAGDVDLDGLDEIVLAAKRVANDNVNVYLYDLLLIDDALTGYKFFNSFRVVLGPDGQRPIQGILPNVKNNLFHPALKVFTKRTRPALEKAIYAGAYLVDGLQNLLPSSTTAFDDNDLSNHVTTTLMSSFETEGGGWNHAPNEVAVGDIDGSGQDSVVGLWDTALIGVGSPPAPTTLARVTWDAGKSKWGAWSNIAATTGGIAPATGPFDSSYGVGLCLPNVDRDSPIVEYQGEHEVLFSSPRVLAVLAAAPYFEGKNESNSSTSISFGDGKGFAADSTIGLRTGTSIGYEAPNLFGTTTFETKLTFGYALDRTSSRAVTLDQTQTWTAGNEDAVVFQVIPFDVYYYKVVSSPAPEDLGTPLSINVPRKLNTYKVPVAVYNESIVDGPLISSALLNHTVGDPRSYPNQNACAKAANGGTFGETSFLIDADRWCYASESPLHVGVGTGSVGFSIARTETSSEGTSTDLSVDFEVVAGAGGLSIGQSVGFHWGYGYTVDTTKSYNFSGQVGDLPDAKHGYDFGLMAHRGQLGLGTGYPIFLVDYWVEHVE